MSNFEKKLTEAMNTKMGKIEGEMKVMQQKIAHKDDIQSKVKEEIKSELDKFKKVMENIGHTNSGASETHKTTPISPGTQLRQTVENVTTEIKQREERRKNIVIYNLEEPKTNLKEERINKDKEKLIEISSGTLEIKNLKKHEMCKVTRLGEKVEDQTRPLLVEFSTESRKDMIFKRLIKLKGSEYERVSFTHDMTKLERAQQKKLLIEAKSKQQEDVGGSMAVQGTRTSLGHENSKISKEGPSSTKQPRKPTGGRAGRGGKEGGKLKAKPQDSVKSVDQTVHMQHDFNLNKDFSCFYTNADSLSNKIDELKLVAKNSQPKIIAICEVKPQNSRYDLTAAEIQLDGYELHHTSFTKGKHR
jgi:hypothetical protein